MIGLQRGTVKLVPHATTWRARFLRESRLLMKLPEVVAVEHIGSTSVPGLRAKPIIDILVGVQSITAFRRHLSKVERLGYRQKKNVKYANRRYFFTRGSEQRRTVHVHVERYQGTKWKHNIFFRDWLRTHPRDRRRYEVLKVRLASAHPKEREQYTKGKKAFISSILKRRT